MAIAQKKPGKQGQHMKKPVGGVKNKYPTRSAINLVFQPKHTKTDVLSLAMFVVFLAILAVFTKFMVLDQLAAADAARRAYQEKEHELQVLVEANREFDEVEKEYSRYGLSYMTQEELDRQYRTSMLQVIEDKVSDQYETKSINISGNTVTLSLKAEKLRDVSDIVNALNESPLVAYVTFSTAATNDERVETRDADGNVVVESVKESLNANITVYFKTLTEVAAAQAAEEGGAA